MPKTGCYEDATVPLRYCLGIMFLEWRGFDQIPFKIGIQDLAIGMKLGNNNNKQCKQTRLTFGRSKSNRTNTLGISNLLYRLITRWHSKVIAHKVNFLLFKIVNWHKISYLKQIKEVYTFFKIWKSVRREFMQILPNRLKLGTLKALFYC